MAERPSGEMKCKVVVFERIIFIQSSKQFWFLLLWVLDVRLHSMATIMSTFLQEINKLPSNAISESGILVVLAMVLTTLIFWNS